MVPGVGKEMGGEASGLGCSDGTSKGLWSYYPATNSPSDFSSGRIFRAFSFGKTDAGLNKPLIPNLGSEAEMRALNALENYILNMQKADMHSHPLSPYKLTQGCGSIYLHSEKLSLSSFNGKIILQEVRLVCGKSPEL